jgi:hypothetical protein
MPKDFTPGTAKAFVDMGDGGAHDPQIRFTADDESCMWNDFPVYIYACGWRSFTPVDPAITTQLLPFTTTPGGGSSAPSDAEWPYMRVYDARWASLAGYDLQFRYRFHAASGGTSVGSAAVIHVGGSACGDAVSGPIIGDFIQTSFVLAASCIACTSDSPSELSMVFTNFSPIAGDVTITLGKLEAQWVTNGDTPPDFAPDQTLTIEFNGPCEAQPGLFIGLEVDSCGVPTKTYTQIANAVNALNLGITASILGGHGGDTAKPDPSCTTLDPITATLCDIVPVTIHACRMAGADCSGALDWPYTG